MRLASALILAVAGCGAVAEPNGTSGCDQTYPELTGHVVDEAQLLSPSDETKLTERLAALEARTKHQMVVATVKSLQGKPIDRYSLCLANHWAIGRKGFDDGVVFTIAPTERNTRIEVGKGLTSKLTDDEAKTVLERDVIPQFRKGDFAAGIVAGSEAIMREVE